MQIKVLFFAQLRELFGTSEMSLSMVEGASVEEAVQEIVKDKETISVDWKGIKYAVNEEFSDSTNILCDQDTLVLLPPVSGG